MIQKVIKIWASFPMETLPMLKWFIGRKIFPEIKKLRITTGTGGGPIYTAPGEGSIPISEPGKLMGMPIELIEGDHIILGMGK